MQMQMQIQMQIQIQIQILRRIRPRGTSCQDRARQASHLLTCTVRACYYHHCTTTQMCTVVERVEQLRATHHVMCFFQIMLVIITGGYTYRNRLASYQTNTHNTPTTLMATKKVSPTSNTSLIILLATIVIVYLVCLATAVAND